MQLLVLKTFPKYIDLMTTIKSLIFLFIYFFRFHSILRYLEDVSFDDLFPKALSTYSQNVFHVFNLVEDIAYVSNEIFSSDLV